MTSYADGRVGMAKAAPQVFVYEAFDEANEIKVPVVIVQDFKEEGIEDVA